MTGTTKPNFKHSAIPKNRPSGSALVLDGSEVKLRLLAERRESKSVVHIDWVRFTALLRNAPAPSSDMLFPLCVSKINGETVFMNQVRSIFADLPNCDFDASAQAYELATKTAVALGSEFVVAPEVRKGHDFYKFRWAIERHGAECGWVGFLSSSESPRQQSQSKTVHVNLFGAACTFASSGWNDRLADLVEDCAAVLTRCDLALDFFDGLPGGLDSIVTQYQAGLCDVNGRKPKSNCIGDWHDKKRGRSFYLGSKEAGKQTNCYEKGDQLFGIGVGSDWLRIELRYGNKLRVLSAEMLRRPADFFCGASDWHESMLHIADSVVVPEPVPCLSRLPIETVKAECARAVRWLKNTASASMAVAFEYLGESEFVELVSGQKLPGRLSKFSRAEIKNQFSSALAMVSEISLTRVPGTVATFSVDSCPAFA